jgi:hypothetical protein
MVPLAKFGPEMGIAKAFAAALAGERASSTAEE